MQAYPGSGHVARWQFNGACPGSIPTPSKAAREGGDSGAISPQVTVGVIGMVRGIVGMEGATGCNYSSPARETQREQTEELGRARLRRPDTGRDQRGDGWVGPTRHAEVTDGARGQRYVAAPSQNRGGGKCHKAHAILSRSAQFASAGASYG